MTKRQIWKRGARHAKPPNPAWHAAPHWCPARPPTPALCFPPRPWNSSRSPRCESRSWPPLQQVQHWPPSLPLPGLHLLPVAPCIAPTLRPPVPQHPSYLPPTLTPLAPLTTLVPTSASHRLAPAVLPGQDSIVILRERERQLSDSLQHGFEYE